MAPSRIVDGVPKSNVVKTCLKLGGFPATAARMRDAILAGWAEIQGMEDGEKTLPPEAGLATTRRTIPTSASAFRSILRVRHQNRVGEKG